MIRYNQIQRDTKRYKFGAGDALVGDVPDDGGYLQLHRFKFTVFV